MLKLSEFRHNHHPSEMRMLAKFIRRGFSIRYKKILWGLLLIITTVACSSEILPGSTATPQKETSGAPGLDQPVSTAEPVQSSLIVKPTLGPVVSTATVEAGCQALHPAVVPDTPGAPVRSGPGTSYEILGLLPPNQALSTLEISQNGEWLKFPFRDRTGWIFTGLVLLTDKLADTPGATKQGMSNILEGTPFDQAKNLAAIRAYTGQPDLQLLFIRLEPTPEQSNLDQQSALYFDCNGKRYWVDLLTLYMQE